MIVTEHPVPSAEELRASERHLYPFLCWRSILGGTVAAIGVHLLLIALGLGAGLATFTPMTDANPATNLSVGTAIIWTICALVALAFGGFVAGRFSRSRHSGFVHGVLVWSLTLILSILLVSMGTGMVLGGAMKVLGEGLGIGAKAAASGASEVAAEGVKRSGEHLTSFINEAVPAGGTNASPQNSIRARREVGLALTRLFNPANEGSVQENRATVVKSLQSYAGMSEADAARTVEEWSASYKALQEDLAKEKVRLEQQARELADRAASNLSHAAIWTFFALLAGLLVTAFSGSCGASGALRAMVVSHSSSARLESHPLTATTAP